MIINDENENVEDKLIKVYEAAKALIDNKSRYIIDEDDRSYCAVCKGYDGKCTPDCEWNILEDVVNNV